MDDKMLILILSIIFIVLQFVFKRMETKTRKEIIAAFKEGFSSFERHAAISSSNNTLLKQLNEAHSKVDAEGRPLWYMPHSMVRTQEELVKLSHTIAQTQKILSSMMKETRRDINDMGEDLKIHAKECREKV